MREFQSAYIKFEQRVRWCILAHALALAGFGWVVIGGLLGCLFLADLFAFVVLGVVGVIEVVVIVGQASELRGDRRSDLGCPWTTGGDENGVGAVRCGRPTTYRCDAAVDTCERHRSSCCVLKDGP